MVRSQSTPTTRSAIKSRARSNIKFTSKDGLDANLLGCLEELDSAMHIAMVRHGDRRLPKRGRLLKHLRDSIEAVEETVLGVEVKMDEILRQRTSPFLITTFSYSSLGTSTLRTREEKLSTIRRQRQVLYSQTFEKLRGFESTRCSKKVIR